MAMSHSNTSTKPIETLLTIVWIYPKWLLLVTHKEQ